MLFAKFFICNILLFDEKCIFVIFATPIVVHILLMSESYIINIKEGVARNAVVRFACPLNLSIEKGEHVAFVGDNGAGKSILVDTLLGKYPLVSGTVEYDFSPSPVNTVYENVRCITFRDVYGSAEADYCYQLRWNVHEQEGLPRVCDFIGSPSDVEYAARLFALFGIDGLIDKLIVMLSSGELRKLQIVKALLDSPRLLVLDNPFIGLDAEARAMLVQSLSGIADDGYTQIAMLLPSGDNIPDFVDSVITVKRMDAIDKLTIEEYRTAICGNDVCLSETVEDDVREMVAALPAADASFAGEEVLSFNRVNVVYGGYTILENLSWRVLRGQAWALSGANGSGKSTLLSLVCADNLQSYACNISLFGRRRGSGESIWEIKRKIGYVSPEMHRSYMRNIPVIEIVASGLHDSIGLYRRSTESQMLECRRWMRIFGIDHLCENSFLRISSGEQRLALLARAFVKDPELLILDEPMHGLDAANRSRVKAVIEAYFARKGKTLIMVTHNEGELPACITDSMTLKRGRRFVAVREN